MDANQSTTSITSSRNGARESGVSGQKAESLQQLTQKVTKSPDEFGTYGAERSSEPYSINDVVSRLAETEKPIKKFNRQGKWARFSGTDEDLARAALDHAKFQASKRRPLLKQISHSMSRRNGFNSQEEFDTVDEQWVWCPNNSQNNLQLQAVNCSICGNYIRVSDPNFPLSDHIQCNCNDGYDNYTDNDGLEEFKEYEYNDEEIA